MSVTVSITVDDVITALGGLLAPFCGDAQIIRGQQNRVAPPAGAFVELTEIMRASIETPTVGSVVGGQSTITGPQRLDIQMDFYGPLAGNQSAAIAAIFRTGYACSQFPDGIAPLYCSDARQSPLTTGEEQYEQRWTMTASLQYNPAVTLPQQFATQLGPVNTSRFA